MRLSAGAILAALPSLLSAQCSDAGACSAGRIGTGPANRIALTAVEAASGAPYDLRFHTLRLDGQFHLGSTTQVLVTVPFVRVNGPAGSTSGLGDVVGILDQTFASGPDWSWAGQIGARFDTGEDDGDPALPQRYQTGLGPTDFILGVRGAWRTWQAGLVFQNAGSRSDNPIDRLQRGDDLLLWASKDFAFGATQLTIKGLAIQRLSLSTVRDPSSPAERFIEVPESDRLQLNLEGALTHSFNRNFALQIGAAIPFLKRPSNVDGLKRSWTASVGVVWSF